MTRTRGHLATIALASTIALGTLLFWLYSAGAFPSLQGYSYHVQALVPDAGGLISGSSVRIAGVEVGRVTGITREGTGALIGLKIKGSDAPLPVDTRVGIRLRTLVGEIYVSLYPGRSRQTLPNGAVLPMTQAEDYVEADQILNSLRGPTRASARALIQGLGGAVAGRGPELNGLFQQASGLIQNGGALVAILTQDRQGVARLVDNLGRLTQAVGERGQAIESVAQTAGTSFRAIASRDAAVQALIKQLPPTLDQVQSTTGTLRAITAHVAPVLSNLANTVLALKPAVDSLRPAATEGHHVLDELSSTAPGLQTTLTRLEQLEPEAVSALPQVNKVFCQTNPALQYLSPYAPEVSALVQNLGSLTGFYDANAHAARLNPTVGVTNLKVISPTIANALSVLLNSGAIGKSYVSGYDAYPAPGHVTDVTTGRGVYGPGGTSTPYHRVLAAC